jgi:glyoxylase-like metal-dependent hydrolase (beta-lactamase superfamily II)
MRLEASGLLLIASIGIASLASGQAPGEAPLVRENATARIAPHTYYISDMNIPAVPNVGIVVGDRGALVIDTGLGFRNGETVFKEALKVAPQRELYLATTHVHPEHDLGAGGFPPLTKMIRSSDQQKEIADVGLTTARSFSARSPVMADLLRGAEFRKADISFERDYLLDLGGVRVRVMAVGPAHTRGDTAFYVEGDGVLFSGDVAMPALPVLASPGASSVRAWVESLERFGALKPAHVVPSHGPMGDSSMIAAYGEFFAAVQRRVGELKKEGKSVDETALRLTAELQEKYAKQQPGRIGPIARAVFAEFP